jgi:hypothetical protein
VLLCHDGHHGGSECEAETSLDDLSALEMRRSLRHGDPVSGEMANHHGTPIRRTHRDKPSLALDALNRRSPRNPVN